MSLTGKMIWKQVNGDALHNSSLQDEDKILEIVLTEFTSSQYQELYFTDCSESYAILINVLYNYSKS